MTFQEWWDSEERDSDWFLPIIAHAAWDASAAAERERLGLLAESQENDAGFHSLSAAEIRAGKIGA